ncbi:5'-3' exonuclease [Salibacterium halotolerans]|uniref:5'-3' exonuclease n=1 Tax=Salibacterium halotolerans TaxID=1884432 RepID=A0A1I5QGF6_9BACI|nr:5'-3' exonuclease [Salibacterium halotolerans]SFP45338.1 5'-3' exonuclease [Salibacterium halotolerans]
MKNSHILLIDGMALLFRGFYATSVYGNYMYNNQNTPTNAVYGMLKHFLKAVEAFRPSHIICCWDMGSTTFRTSLYPDYKANRSDPPEELIPQFDMAKEAMTAFDVPNIGVPWFEADDCIGTIAGQADPSSKVTVLTGDQDLLQLITPNVDIAVMKKGQGHYTVFNENNIMEEKGYCPGRVVEMKALMGDTTDNYPGVKGIGEKTALKLLNEYGSLDSLLEQMDKLPKGIKNKIETHMDMLHLSRHLAAIRRDAPVKYNENEALWTADKEHVFHVLRQMGIHLSIDTAFQTDEESRVEQ